MTVPAGMTPIGTGRPAGSGSPVTGIGGIASEAVAGRGANETPPPLQGRAFSEANGQQAHLTHASGTRIVIRPVATRGAPFLILIAPPGTGCRLGCGGRRARPSRLAARGDGIAAMPLAEVRSPLPGRVAELHARAGDEVAVGQELVTIESMKNLVPVPSPHAGRVAAVHVEIDSFVDEGSPLLSVETA